MKKKVLAIVLSIATVLSMAGCGSSSATSDASAGAASAAASVASTASSAASKEDTSSAASSSEVSSDASSKAADAKDITITVFHYMAQTTKQAGLDAVEKAFAAEQPDYNITWNNVFYNQGTDYFPQLQTALAGGSQPEIIMGNPGLYPDIVSQGYAADLTDNEVIKSLNLPAGDLGDVSSDGKIYGFPIDFKTWGVFYNKTIFKKLGIEIPTTYTELLDDCQKISDAGIDPWAHAFGDAVFGDIEMRNYVWTKALDAGDKDVFEKLMSGEKKLTDYPYFKDGLELWAKRLKWMRSDAMSNDQNAALEVFTSGQAAMMYFGSWGIGDLESMIKGTDFEYGFFVEPIDDTNGARMNVQVDQSFMVNPNSENYDMALKFMEYWVQKGGDSWSKVSLMPLLSGQVADNAPDIVKTLAKIKASGNISHYGDFTKPFNSQFTTDWRTYLTAFAESYSNGTDFTADKTLEDMQAKFDQDIAEAG